MTHSFPTRRSSDLKACAPAKAGMHGLFMALQPNPITLGKASYPSPIEGEGETASVAGLVEFPREPGGQQAHGGDHQQRVVDRQAETDEQAEDQRRGDHEARIDDIVRGDGARGRKSTRMNS